MINSFLTFGNKARNIALFLVILSFFSINSEIQAQLATTDAGVEDFIINQNYCRTTDDIKVVIKNFGSDTLKTVKIQWSIDGLNQTEYNWTGSLLSNSTDTVSLLTSSFVPIDSFNLKVWTELPNSIPDTVNFNDTVMVNNIWPVLSGDYSIGQTVADFSSVIDAVEALKTYGVCGSVVFNIDSGTYVGKFSIPEIAGASLQNTITFQSANGDSTGVILSRNYASNSTNYLIEINGADFITFKNLTLETTSPLYNKTVIWINNIIRVVAEDYYFSNTVIFSDDFVSCSNNSIENNLIKNGGRGIELEGDYSSVNNVIKNNSLDGQNIYGIVVETVQDILIESNIISSFNIPGDYQGLSLRYTKAGVYVAGNSIMSDRGSGIRLFYCIGDTSIPNIVVNNFVSVPDLGIQSSSSDYIHYYFNSIQSYSIGSSSGNIAFHNDHGEHLTLLNNIFTQSAGGYALFLQGGYEGGVDSSNYNNIYSSGTYIARVYSNASYTNFPDINSIHTSMWNHEQNSVSIDPLYTTTADLHVFNPAIDGIGTPISGITMDIDDDIRDVISPDIGADEFTPQDNDAAIISFDGPVNICEGNNDVFVSIKNCGTDTLFMLDIVLEINGVIQNTYNWSDTLIIGVAADSINIGTYNFPQDSCYNFKVWCKDPNMTNDSNHNNDTIIVSKIFLPSLSGIYTIGGFYPDYQMISDAVDALSNNGICGPVTFNIRDGVYNEQFVIPEIFGADSVNTISFISESQDTSLVTICYYASSNDNYIMKLNSTDYITFKHLTFRSLNPIYSIICEIEYTAIHNHFINNHFIGNDINSNTYESCIVYSDMYNDDYTVFSGNTFEKGSIALMIEGSSYETDVHIVNNIFRNQRNFAIRCRKQKSMLITNNIFETDTSAKSYKAIFFDLSSKNIFVNNNYLNNIRGSGIIFDDVSYGTIYNNFVSVIESQPDQFGWKKSGICLNESSNTKVYHNTVRVFGQDTMAIAFNYRDFDWDNEVFNNVFCNDGKGPAAYFYNDMIESNNNDFYSNGNTLIVKYNYGASTDYFSSLSQWVNSSGLDSNSCSVIPQFVSQNDLHIATNIHLDNTGTPVGISSDIDGDTRSTTNPDIGADEFTSFNNDAGIFSVCRPLKACSHGDVYVTIENTGANNLNNCEINWKVNGISQNSYQWAGLLYPAFISDSINIGNYNFNTDSTYTIDAWTSNPNNNNDPYFSNDSSIFIFDLFINMDIGNDTSICDGSSILISPDNTFETYLWSTGSTSSSILANTAACYYLTITDTNGCPKTDSINLFINSTTKPVISINGSSLLSSYVNINQWYFNGNLILYATSQVYTSTQTGYYQVEHTDSNGCPTISDSVYVELAGLNGFAADNSGINIYPNPNNGIFKLNIKAHKSEKIEIEIYNSIGEVVFERITLIPNKDIDISHLYSGIYYLKIIINNKIYFKKIITN